MLAPREPVRAHRDTFFFFPSRRRFVPGTRQDASGRSRAKDIRRQLEKSYGGGGEGADRLLGGAASLLARMDRSGDGLVSADEFLSAVGVQARREGDPAEAVEVRARVAHAAA